jgi:uncharacterized protein (TIGR02246 family)
MFGGNKMVTVKTDTDVAAISGLWKAYASALGDGDLDRWLSLWIPEGIQMPPGAPKRIGMQQIREGNSPLTDLFDSVLDIVPDEIRILGDHAYSHGNFEYTMTPKEGGDAVSGQGKFLTIFVRQADGSWKIAIDCFNDNAPPAAA